MNQSKEATQGVQALTIKYFSILFLMGMLCMPQATAPQPAQIEQSNPDQEVAVTTPQQAMTLFLRLLF